MTKDNDIVFEPWMSYMYYSKGQRVTFNGINYTCIQNHISDTHLLPHILNGILWTNNIKAPDVTFSVWTPYSYYFTDDIVLYNNYLYKCLRNHFAGNPSMSINWALV